MEYFYFKPKHSCCNTRRSNQFDKSIDIAFDKKRHVIFFARTLNLVAQQAISNEQIE